MKKSSNPKTVESQLKELNNINRSEVIKKRSFHQIMVKVNEPENTAPNHKMTHILRPIFLSIAAVILLGLVSLGFLNNSEPNHANVPDEEKDVPVTERDDEFAENEFDPSTIKVNDVVAGMKLIDGDYYEDNEQRFLTNGVFKGEVKISGIINHYPGENYLFFRFDELSLNKLPTPKGEIQYSFRIANEDWLMNELNSKPGDIFHVEMTIDQYYVKVHGSGDDNKLQVSNLDRHYTKLVEDLSSGGTYTNAKFGYSFTIPKAWEGNLVVEEDKSTTTFYHSCSKDETRQMYLQLMVSNESVNTGKVKILATEAGNVYMYQKPSDIHYQNDQCASDFSGRYNSAFNDLSPNDYFQLVNPLTLSVFNPDEIQVGDEIAGLVVSNIKKEPKNGGTSYYVDFIGEFTVKGSIFYNQVGGGYTIMMEDNLWKVPHSLNEHERGKVFFNIKFDSEKERVLGEKLENLEPNGKIDIEAVFKNYSYNLVPSTDVGNTAEFVKLTTDNNTESGEEAAFQSIYPKANLEKVEYELLFDKEQLVNSVKKIDDYVGVEYSVKELILMDHKYNVLEKFSPDFYDKGILSAATRFIEEKQHQKVERVEEIGENTVMVVTKDRYVYKLLLEFNEQHEVWLVHAIGAM